MSPTSRYGLVHVSPLCDLQTASTPPLLDAAATLAYYIPCLQRRFNPAAALVLFWPPRLRAKFQASYTGSGDPVEMAGSAFASSRVRAGAGPVSGSRLHSRPFHQPGRHTRPPGDSSRPPDSFRRSPFEALLYFSSRFRKAAISHGRGAHLEILARPAPHRWPI